MGADIYTQLSWFSQERVAAAHVLVAGAQQPLALRALLQGRHRPTYIYKVDAAARRLKEMTPRLEVHTMKGDIAHCIGIGELRQTDVAI